MPLHDRSVHPGRRWAQHPLKRRGPHASQKSKRSIVRTIRFESSAPATWPRCTAWRCAHRRLPWPGLPPIAMVRMADIVEDSGPRGRGALGVGRAHDGLDARHAGRRHRRRRRHHPQRQPRALRHRRLRARQACLLREAAREHRRAAASAWRWRRAVRPGQHRQLRLSVWPAIELAPPADRRWRARRAPALRGTFLPGLRRRSHCCHLAWQFDKAVAGGGAFGDIGSHIMDIACALMGPVRA